MMTRPTKRMRMSMITSVTIIDARCASVISKKQEVRSCQWVQKRRRDWPLLTSDYSLLTDCCEAAVFRRCGYEKSPEE